MGRESSSSLVCIQHKQQQLSTDLRASQGNKKQTELGADALRPCQETNLLNQQSQDTESGFSPRLTRLQVFTARIPHSCTELFALHHCGYQQLVCESLMETEVPLDVFKL